MGSGGVFYARMRGPDGPERSALPLTARPAKPVAGSFPAGAAGRALSPRRIASGRSTGLPAPKHEARQRKGGAPATAKSAAAERLDALLAQDLFSPRAVRR